MCSLCRLARYAREITWLPDGTTVVIFYCERCDMIAPPT